MTPNEAPTRLVIALSCSGGASRQWQPLADALGTSYAFPARAVHVCLWDRFPLLSYPAGRRPNIHEPIAFKSKEADLGRDDRKPATSTNAEPHARRGTDGCRLQPAIVLHR